MIQQSPQLIAVLNQMRTDPSVRAFVEWLYESREATRLKMEATVDSNTLHRLSERAATLSDILVAIEGSQESAARLKRRF